jgi:GGDEF domain-containing protein
MYPSSQRATNGHEERRPNVVARLGMPLGEAGAAIPPRFERQLRGATRRRRGTERPWVAVAKVNGIAEIRSQYGDPAAEEFLRGTATVLRASLRESDKLAPVARGEYGIILDAPSGDEVVAGLRRLVQKVRELAVHDRQWSVGSLCIGAVPLSSDEPAAILERARAALERASKHGGSVVIMSTDLG